MPYYEFALSVRKEFHETVASFREWELTDLLDVWYNRMAYLEIKANKEKK